MVARFMKVIIIRSGPVNWTYEEIGAEAIDDVFYCHILCDSVSICVAHIPLEGADPAFNTSK